METYRVFDVPLTDVSQDELMTHLAVDRGLVITPNPEILLAARRSEDYRNILSQAVLSLPDGIATRFAVAALCGKRDLTRHTGIDTIPFLARIAQHNHESVVVLGGFAEDFPRIRSAIESFAPSVSVHCIDPGTLSEDVSSVSEPILEEIRAFGPCVLLVGLGQGKGRSQGKQERIAADCLLHAPNVRLVIGVGGTLDVLAGKAQRSPVILQRLGFEWLWRLVRNPWRFRRIRTAVVVFPITVAYDTLRMKRFLRAIRDVARSLSDHFLRNPL